MPNTSQDLTTAKAWLSQCDQHHQDVCGRVNSRWAPTRLVHFKRTSEGCDIRLVQTEASTCYRYLALSYCWGDYQPLKTFESNFAQHQNSISYFQLPKTFADLFVVAEALEIEYVWIDAVCIIQNSDTDKQTECASMADVYTNAVVTIVTLDAANSGEGFLHHYEDPDDKRALLHLNASCIRERWPTWGADKPIDLVLEAVPKSEEPDSIYQSVPILATRGWV